MIFLLVGCVVLLIVLFTILGVLKRRIDEPPPATMESGSSHMRSRR